MRRLYTALFYLITPFLVVRLLIKSRRLNAYRQRVSERFSFVNSAPTPVDVWVHATSLGEVVTASPLIEAMLALQWRVLVTTMTPTGSQHVTKRFGAQVVHQYIPYDLPMLFRRFFKKYTPRLGIIMETELWPNAIYQAKRENIPLFLLNARLSDKAFKQYKKVAWMFKPVLNCFEAVFAQSEEDARRFMALGASTDKVDMLGNMKFDVECPIAFNDECAQLKEKWGQKRPVIIAASTHDNEEQQWLSHLRQLQTSIAKVMLLLVPRHPERFNAVYELSVGQGFNTARRSQPLSIHENTEVVIVDSLGELMDFYRVSDYAFVGGSLVPVGGHNVLEPIALDVPVFCGPYIHNAKALCKALKDADAIVIANDIDEVVTAISTMHEHTEQKSQQVTSASLVLAVNRGTVKRYVEKIEAILV